MAEPSFSKPVTQLTESSDGPKVKVQQRRTPSIHQIYSLPAPIRTFPLPTFIPNNPLSVIYIAYAWLKQTLQPPPAEPATIHHGVWSHATTSVHVTNEKSMKDLWEQGFYGKGSLSRSEPNWLKRELVRRGAQDSYVSELMTAKRREERAQAKWERARLEQEAILQTRLEEAQRAEQRQQRVRAVSTLHKAPVGPMELLALPNSSVKNSYSVNGFAEHFPVSASAKISSSSNVSLIEQLAGISANTGVLVRNGSMANGIDPVGRPSIADGLELPHGPEMQALSATQLSSSSPLTDEVKEKTIKRQKSVRFSPTVESATFKLCDPPSPNGTSALRSEPVSSNGIMSPDSVRPTGNSLPNGRGAVPSKHEESDIVSKERLQLTPEEALFLSFSLGALSVTDPLSGLELSTKDMFLLFRQYSYSTPRAGPNGPDLRPDDNFLLHYVVYHHFRSLGWVPRPGIKFAVDWLLYTRGPVFDHAEFGLIVLPSYSHEWWKAHGTPTPSKSWQWLHSVVRVLSHAVKSLVLVYVEVPPPTQFNGALELGIPEALKLYQVREVMVKRWSSNRNR